MCAAKLESVFPRAAFAKGLALAPLALGIPVGARASRYYSGDYKVALNFYSFSRVLNTADGPDTFSIVDYAKRTGFDAVDIWAYYVPGYDDHALPADPAEVQAYARRLRRYCAQRGLAICGTGIRTNFATPDAAKREFDMKRARYWLTVAATLGVPLLRVFSGPVPRGYEHRWGQTEVWMADCFDRLANLAKTYGIKLGVQEHADSLATSQQVISLMKLVNNPNFGLIVDTGEFRPPNALLGAGYHWYADIEAVLPYTINFAIKFKPGGVEDTELIDMPRLMRMIRRSAYRAYLPIEYVSRKDGSEEWEPYKKVPQLLKMVRDALAQTKAPPSAT